MKMKFLYLWLVAMAGVLPALAQENVGVKFIDKPLEELLLLAKQENKLVFIDCYSTYCGPCKAMLRKEFPKKEMGDYLNAEFISAKMNLDLGDGPALSQKWDVHSFPTFLFMDSDGNILHRMMGYMTADQFIREAQKGLADNSFRSLEKKYQSGERSREVVLAYLEGLKKNGRSQMYHDVVMDFLSSPQIDLLSDTLAFSLFCRQVRSPYDSLFLKVYENREAFVERYGEKAERKLQDVWWDYPRSFTVFEGREFKGFDKDRVQDYAIFMEQHDVDSKGLLLDINLSQACLMEAYGEIWKWVNQYYDLPDALDGSLNYAFSLLSNKLTSRKEQHKLAKMIRFRIKVLEQNGQAAQQPYPGEQIFNPEMYKSVYQQILNEIEK